MGNSSVKEAGRGSSQVYNDRLISQVLNKNLPHHFYNTEPRKIVCNYCHNSINLKNYRVHLDLCRQNPFNQNNSSDNRAGSSNAGSRTLGPDSILVECDFCKGVIDKYHYEEHFRVCEKNPQNMKVPCGFCQEKIRKSYLEDHQRICSLNPENLAKDTARGFNRPRGRSMRKDSSKDTGDNQCCICLEEISSSQDAKFLNCCHKFHGSCITKWSQLQKSCPICRSNFLI